MLQKPKDLLGAVLTKILEEKVSNTALASGVSRWRMTVVIDTDFYPVSIVFDRGIRVEYGARPDAQLRVRMTMSTMSDVFQKRASVLQSVLRRKIRVRGLARHPVSALRFYRLMSRLVGD
ncbi:MAG: hypothetical protein HXY34_07220 [Candidatus Thorarchaeota archaeon]|nr:hypothetical protein [Candidatus Thorarchaeota archaeon]